MEQCKIVKTRPIFPYPMQARYNRKGSVDDAANFVGPPSSFRRSRQLDWKHFSQWFQVGDVPVERLIFTWDDSEQHLFGNEDDSQPIHCIHCHGTDIVKFGKTPEGKQRYKCREDACNGRTFILNYSHLGRLRGTKQQIIDMAMNGSGVQTQLEFYM